MASIGGHHKPKSDKDEWLTPPELLKALGPFDLDPCAPVHRPWDMAKYHYDITQDGLNKPWHGFVWVNPPYGRNNIIWLERAAEYNNGIALTFARTETEMFVKHVWPKANALLFLYGRLFFHHVDGSKAKGNSGAPSVLIAYGCEATHRLRDSGIPGAFVYGWRK